jgi:hypothetical protein
MRGINGSDRAGTRPAVANGISTRSGKTFRLGDGAAASAAQFGVGFGIRIPVRRTAVQRYRHASLSPMTTDIAAMTRARKRVIF